MEACSVIFQDLPWNDWENMPQSRSDSSPSSTIEFYGDAIPWLSFGWFDWVVDFDFLNA